MQDKDIITHLKSISEHLTRSKRIVLKKQMALHKIPLAMFAGIDVDTQIIYLIQSKRIVKLNYGRLSFLEF